MEPGKVGSNFGIIAKGAKVVIKGSITPSMDGAVQKGYFFGQLPFNVTVLQAVVPAVITIFIGAVGRIVIG
jgi:hypothetical protein